jgi:hypothetical protein
MNTVVLLSLDVRYFIYCRGVGTYRSADRALAISSGPTTSVYKAMKLDRINDL